MKIRLTKRKFYKHYDWLFKELFNELEEIFELKDNWNQYGAKPISAVVISDFNDFLIEFKKSKLSHSAIMHSDMIYVALHPTIHPTANDTIQFEIQPNPDFYFEYNLGKRSCVIMSSIYMRMVVGQNKLKIKKFSASIPEVFLHIKMFYLYYIEYVKDCGDITEEVYLKCLDDILLA